MTEDPAHILDLVTLEGRLGNDALEGAMARAEAGTGAGLGLLTALDHFFSALEIVGRLRPLDPDHAELLARHYRDAIYRGVRLLEDCKVT